VTLQAEGYIANETWATDETELNANANKRLRQKIMIPKTIHLKKEELEMINQFCMRHRKKALKSIEPKIEYHQPQIC